VRDAGWPTLGTGAGVPTSLLMRASLEALWLTATGVRGRQGLNTWRCVEAGVTISARNGALCNL